MELIKRRRLILWPDAGRGASGHAQSTSAIEKLRAYVQVMRTPNPLPFPDSYWVVPGKLLAGIYPGSLDPEEARQKLMGLIEVGIRRVINLQEADERDYSDQLFVPYERELQRLAAARNVQVTMIRMPIRDMHACVGSKPRPSPFRRHFVTQAASR